MIKSLRLVVVAACVGMIATPASGEVQTDEDQFKADLIEQITQWIEENELLKGWNENIQTLRQTARLLNYHLKDRPLITTDGSTFNVNEIWRAPVDALYYGIGDDRNDYTPYGFSQEEIDAALKGDDNAKAKRTGSYVWAMENIDGKIYWGMNHNFMCHAMSTGTGSSSSPTFAVLSQPYETSCWTCEANYDKRVRESGDIMEADLIWPRSYVYDPQTGFVTDISPEQDELTRYTQGFRAAGGLNGVAFLCGPDEKFGSSIYAFDTATDQLIVGSHFEGAIKNDPEMIVTNMRKFIILDDVLYLGIAWRKEDGSNGGAILRWYGDKKDPLNFQVVALCDQCAAEITIHNDYLFIGGWTTGQLTSGDAGSIFRSKTPYNPQTGLTPDNIMEFDKMWSLAQYEKNRPNLNTQYIGELRSYKGKLYWGSLSAMQTAPFIGSVAYKPTNSIETINGILGTVRPATLWRADFSSADDKTVEMLYGDTEVPVFDFQTRKWSMVSTGYTPTFGRSGFGSIFNNYGAWAMREYKGSLYIGCMDISTLIEPTLNSTLFGSADDKGKAIMNIVLEAFNKFSQLKDPKGYNLYRLDDPNSPVKCITNDGFGNPYAYGIRNLCYLNDNLVIGTANPQTLSEGAGGQVLLFNTDPEAGIEEVKNVPMSVYMRQHDSFIELASVDANKKIESVELYNLSGMKVASEAPDAHEAYLITNNLTTGTYILNARIDNEMFTRKIFIK